MQDSSYIESQGNILVERLFFYFGVFAKNLVINGQLKYVLGNIMDGKRILQIQFTSSTPILLHLSHPSSHPSITIM